LELGPGDSLFSAMLAKAHGAGLCWLVDTGDFAVRDLAAYRAMARHLTACGLASPAMDDIRSLEDLLARCGARYLTDGVASLRQIPTGSVDFVWSQAVLEHVRRRDFDAMLAETRRILRPGGLCSHRIDLQDHLGGALNNLRFSERLWESDWFARSGFYTNRLRFGELVERCRRAGFAVETREVERWPRLPTPRERLAAPFRDLPDDELRVLGCDLILRLA
jgi:SAM-dependent methyltransferase